VRPPTSTTRRRLTRALLLLALGLASTILIASAFSALASHWDPERVATGADIHDANYVRFRTWSQRWLGAEVYAWKHQTDAGDKGDLINRRTPPLQAPAWSSVHDASIRRASITLPSNIKLHADMIAGFPLPALRGRLTPDSLSDTHTIQCREGMLRFRDSTPRISIGDGLWLTGHLFPLIPIWPNFLIDTVLYAALWGALLAAFTRLRRRRRLARNLCPNCAYDLKNTPTGSPCPECGTEPRR
jgi:hypothetical protein